jgi:hypothetical protein
MKEMLQNEKSMPQVFYAKHMKAGVANYPENKEVIYISNDTIADMAKSFEGKPVYVHHQEVDLDNLKDQMDGVVSESFWNKYDGEWWLKFVAISDDAKQAIANGWGVSNCYDHLVRGNGGTCINVKYDSEIIGGQFQHLAIVPNPRYEDAKIYTEEEYNNYIEQKKQKLDKITNSKGENNMEKILNEADVKDLLLSKDSDITVGEAIEVLMNSKKVIDADAEILLANGKKISVSELINACKKNEEDDKEEKENEDKEEEKDFAEGVDYGEKKEKEEPKKLDKEHESEGEKKHIEEEKKEENGCKKNSSALRNAYHTACLNNSKSELQEQADKICDSIFNGIERAKELGI